MGRKLLTQKMSPTRKKRLQQTHVTMTSPSHSLITCPVTTQGISPLNQTFWFSKYTQFNLCSDIYRKTLMDVNMCHWASGADNQIVPHRRNFHVIKHQQAGRCPVQLIVPIACLLIFNIILIYCCIIMLSLNCISSG